LNIQQKRKATAAKSAKNSARDSSGSTHIVLVYDDNNLARALFGQFNENIALIERELGVEAITRGNQLDVHGDQKAVEQTRQVFDHLFARLEQGDELVAGDVEGAVRLVRAMPEAKPKKPENGKGNLSQSSISTPRKIIHPRSKNQDIYIRAMERAELIFGAGPAGTGKTYLAVAYAASLLERGSIDRVILSRPAVEAGEKLGFLPGDMKEKVDPYLRPLYDALYDTMSGEKVERALETGVIEIAPLAFMRGRTLANAAIILDEAQNTTSMQMKMFLTRLGENSKMIVTGDPSQIDLPSGQRSGLVEALELLDGIPGIATVRFTAADIVRHKLVTRIVDAYDAAAGVKDGPASNG
jgi:phosphate starvation-inducible PhoH-like protein